MSSSVINAFADERLVYLLQIYDKQNVNPLNTELQFIVSSMFSLREVFLYFIFIHIMKRKTA